MDITEGNNCFLGESGLQETTIPINDEDSTDIVMRYSAKKQGLPTPSQDYNKGKASKSVPKKGDEKDNSKRNDFNDRSPNRCPNAAAAVRRSRISRESNEPDTSVGRSSGSGKPRGRSVSITKLQDIHNDLSINRDKPKKYASNAKRSRSVSNSPQKAKGKSLDSPKISTSNCETEESPVRSVGKRGRPPKQNCSKDSITKSIERVIEKYASFFSDDTNATRSGIVKVTSKLHKFPMKRHRNSNSGEINSSEHIPVKKKRGRPRGSKNKLILIQREKPVTSKKGNSVVRKHSTETLDTEHSPPLKKVKFTTDDNIEESRYKVNSKPKKLVPKKIKLRNSSMKKKMGLAKVKVSKVKSKLVKNVVIGIKRGVGRPKKEQKKSVAGRKSQKQKENLYLEEHDGEMTKYKSSIKLKSRSPSGESEKGQIKEKTILPIKKKYKREYFSESDNTSEKEEYEVPVIKNPKKAFRDKWKRELKQKSKAEKAKLKEIPSSIDDTNKKQQRREQKRRAVTFDFGKAYDFTDSEAEADKDTDSEHETMQTKVSQKKKATKKKKAPVIVSPIRRTARMASLNARAMMHCMTEDAKVSFSSSNKSELAVVPRKESTIARRHSDTDSDDSDSDADNREKPLRGRPRKKPRETSGNSPVQKQKRRRNELGVTMDIREMVVKKRMASLNASAIMAASYSMESRSRRIPTSNSSENEATDVDIKHRISYKATKEENIKTRSVFTVQETTKKVKKAHGRRRTEVEESIIFKKKVKRRTGMESTDTDKEDNATDASETESVLLPKSPDSAMLIESTITYVSTQTLTVPKSAPGINKHCLSSPNNKTTMVEHISKKSTASTSSSPQLQANLHIGQAISTTNHPPFNPAQKYSPLGALSEMHPVMHPHLQPPHPMQFPQHIIPPPQHPGIPSYHHLGTHSIPSHVGPPHPIVPISHHDSSYPPLSPHSPPYPPPPSKSASNSPAASLSPSSTPQSYCSPPIFSSVSQSSSSSSSPKSSVTFIAPASSLHKVPQQEEQRSQSANRSQSVANCERHHSAFTAPTPSALSPVASPHGYQPVSGPMPTGNTPSSSSYKPPQQGSPISSYGSSSTRVMAAPAKPYKHDYYTVPPHSSYQAHPYHYDKYIRGPPYQFYPQNYPPGGQFGAQGEYNYPAPPAGSMHCSQEYAYTLCIPGPPPQSHHQPLALPPPPASSSSQPNAGPQYYRYPEYAPVFAYPSPGPPGQNAICYPTSKNVPHGSLIGSGKGPEGDHRDAWASGTPYNYQYYNPPNNQAFPHYVSYQHHNANDMNQRDKQTAHKKSVTDNQRERRDSSLNSVEREDNRSNLNPLCNTVTTPNNSPGLSNHLNSEDDAKRNGLSTSKYRQDKKDFKLDVTDQCLPITNSGPFSNKAPEKYITPIPADTILPDSEAYTDRSINVVDMSSTNDRMEQCSDVPKSTKNNHIVSLSSASTVAVPIAQNLIKNDRPRSVPWMFPVSSSTDDISRRDLGNSLKKNCSDFSFTSTTSTISLSSSESHCSSVKSSMNPLVTSAEIGNCQEINDISSTNGDSSLPNNDISDDGSQSEKSVSAITDDIKEPKKATSDQRSGVRHLLCQSQPLSHGKSTSVLVRVKPSNVLSAKSVANTESNKEISLDKSNNFTHSGPKNFFTRSSEISTDSPTEKNSVVIKEGRNLTQPRKRGRPPKAKCSQLSKGDIISTSDGSLFFQHAEYQKQNSGSSFSRNEQLSSSLQQNFAKDVGDIKANQNKILKIESVDAVKIEGTTSNNSGHNTKRVPIKSVNGGITKLYENLCDDDLKHNFTLISNEKLLEQMNTMKHEDDNLQTVSAKYTNIADPKIMEVVRELNRDSFLSTHQKFRQKIGKVGRPSKKKMRDKVRRNKVSLLSYLKEKNNESDTSIDMESRIDNEQDAEKDDSLTKYASLPFPPTSAQLQRKRRCSGLMKNKVTKKPKYCHGWSWQGQPNDGKVWLRNDENLFPRKCYMSMKHKLGDSLRVRDCVLLRSGTRRVDLPYVAKIAALWEDPDNGDMMMSILWYYRPEHTEYGRRPDDLTDEIYASKHRDHLSVACIDDRCYVLTYNEYCRYRCKLRLFQMRLSPSPSPVPQGDEEYLRMERQPNSCVVQDLLFVCKKVYDYRQRRFLKNPI